MRAATKEKVKTILLNQHSELVMKVNKLKSELKQLSSKIRTDRKASAEFFRAAEHLKKIKDLPVAAAVHEAELMASKYMRNVAQMRKRIPKLQDDVAMAKRESHEMHLLIEEAFPFRKEKA